LNFSVLIISYINHKIIKYLNKMYVKYVLIKKFKSYRELSYMEELDPGVNLVIGPNGHGKSNFLDAIIFVLTDKYSGLRQEDKKLLVHEETGEEITEISVELILDNKSRRFPLDKDTINITKIYHVNDNREEILINQKKLLKADVYNLLESAGFCKQNPYYIIQQGKISHIINMNEYELYEIFSEVTGTKVYEEKKEESMKLLEDASENREKILKQSKEINNYISRLEAQCDDLSTFEKLENKKKACEFVIYNEKVADIQVSSDLLEVSKNDQSMVLQDLFTALNQNKEKLNEKLTLQNKYNKITEALNGRIKKCNDEISSINQHAFQGEVSLKLINEKNKNINENKQQLESELKVLISEKQKVNLEYLKILDKLNDIDRDINTSKKQFDDLVNKNEIFLLSSDNGFKSEMDRKAYIQNEMAKVNNFKSEINTKIIDISSTLSEDEQKVSSIETQISKNDSDIKNLHSEIKVTNDFINQNKKERMDCVNEMKKTDLEINEINSENDLSKENIKNIERLIPNNDVVQTILKIKQQNFEGFIGSLLDIIQLDKKFYNSVDLLSKDKLYSLIVDTHETAEKILAFNKSLNGPVISIIPLEWNNKNKNYNYPTTDAIPLIKHIKIKDEYIMREDELRPILQKFFGKCLLVKNYEIGTRYAKQYHMNCITPENEIIYADAFMTKVGYYDYKRQRLNLYEQLLDNKGKMGLTEERVKEKEVIKSQLSNKETRLLRDIQSLVSKKNELSFKAQELIKLNQMLQTELTSLKELINNKKEILDKLLIDKDLYEQKLVGYNNLLNKRIGSSQLEAEELGRINTEKSKIEKKLIELEKAKSYISQQKINLESKLNDIISKKEADLKSKIQELDSSKESTQVFDFTEERNVIDDIESSVLLIQNLQALIKKSKDDKTKVEKELESLYGEITGLKHEQNKINEKINKEESEMKEILLSLRSNNEKKAQLLKNLGNLGVLNSTELEKVTKMKENQQALITNETSIDIRDSERRLFRILEPIYLKLDKINKKMKRFEKINRFAIEDYKIFKEKREEVNEKLQDLKDKEEEILDVIKVLDEKKETAIIDTFNKVKTSFEYLFKELVPNGYANLSLEESSNTQNTKLNKSIYISVSFSGQSNQAMHQLSGGQKTAVAVALIFALSKIDPPPFYILDEIDAALDPIMRNNLAKLISNLSQQNQYIISTFKPEILEVANNIYQVRFVNKTSNLIKIPKEEAKKFIKDNIV
jgi:structural maintenance of chromosome 3 (chondroitin sulfate proteoglycan 6)